MKTFLRLPSLVILSLVAALFIQTLWGAEFPEGLLDREATMTLAATVTAEAFPDADDVLVDNRAFIRYRPDGTSETWDDAAVKILTEKGKRGNRELSLGFTLPYGEVTVPRLEIIRADGTVTAVDVAAQSRVMVDPGQMGSNIYNPNAKVLKVNVPGLEIGDVLRYLVHRDEVKVRVPETWSDYTVAEYTSPIVRYVIEVEAPTELPLRHHVIRDEMAGTIAYTEEKQADGGVRHRWEIRHVPQAFPEPDMPPLHAVAQRILVSTIADWESVSRWYWELCLPRLEATTPTMREMVDSLVAGEADRQRRIEKIFYWVAQNIRYMGITTEEEAPGYEPHDVGITFEHRYGVCRDKAALLVAMYRLAEIEAYPVLIMSGPKKDPEVPNPYFNHAIVAVREADGSYLLMDPTDEKTRSLLPAYLSDCSYLVAHPEGETLQVSPVDPAEENLMRIETRGDLADNGSLLAESELRFDGINDGAYRGWLARQRPDERRRNFEQIIKRAVPGAELLGFQVVPQDLADTTTPLRISLRYLAPDVLVRGDHEVLMPLPWIGTSVGMVNFILGRAGLENRRFPMKTDIACGVEEHFTIRLAGGAVGAALSLPETPPVDLPKIAWEQRLTQTDGQLVGDGRFLLKGVEFTPAEYLELKQILRDMEFSRRKRPLFAAADAAAPGEYGPDVNTAILAEEVVIEVDAPDAWRETRRVRKRILTYAGVKGNGEMKFHFNPAWEEFTLRSATVTAPDGAVQAIREEERNLMDASWVGGAPRYPAERILVASLPGVAIGSVIEYETEHVRRNQPFLSLTEYLQGFDPVEAKTVTVRNPHRLALAVREPGSPEVRRRDDAEMTWSATAVPALRTEPGLPPLWTFVPHVAISVGQWPGYAEGTRRLLTTAADGQPSAIAKARDLVAGAGTATEKVRHIRDHVARTVRHAGPGFDRLPPEAVSPADRTLQDGYGNTTDRAVLLAAMLTAAGLQPEFILTGNYPDLPEVVDSLQSLPMRHAFGQVLVRVVADGIPLHLNDSDQYAELGTTSSEGSLALRLADGSIAPVEVDARHRARSSVRWEIALQEDGTAEIGIVQVVAGPDFGGTRRLYEEMPPEERRRHIQELVAGVSQAAVLVGDLATDFAAYPGQIRFRVRVPRYAVRDGDRLLLNLPDGPGAIPGVGADQRRLPLWWTGVGESLREYRLLLPDAAWRAAILPGSQDWLLPGGGTIAVRISQDADQGILDIAHETRWRPGLTPADTYAWLLEVNRRLTHPRQRAILLERQTPEGE